MREQAVQQIIAAKQDAAQPEHCGNSRPKQQPPHFPASLQKKICPCNGKEIHEKILDAAGIGHIRFHDLRHTFATLSLQNGVDIKTLSNTLGHYSAGFTLDTYTHVTPDMQQEASHIVGGFLENLLGKDLKPWQRDTPEGGARHG